MKALNWIFLILLLPLVFTFNSCNSHRVDPKVEGEKLMKLSREWSRLVATDSIEKVLSFWADDAVCLFPGQPPIKGKKAINEMLKSSVPGTEVSWEPKEAYVSSEGDMAYVFAQNYIKMPDSTGHVTTTFNKSIEIWKKQGDGSWKCVVDMYNLDPTIKAIR
jgi:uncharacterized protein (TIGR02246 family)